MNKVEMIQFLQTQAKRPTQTHDELVEVFENYKTMLIALEASGPDYRKGLQRLREEFPDIERIVIKKHDPILKGRLIDALSTFRKKVEELEGTADEAVETPTEEPLNGERRVRNMPNLGMS